MVLCIRLVYDAYDSDPDEDDQRQCQLPTGSATWTKISSTLRQALMQPLLVQQIDTAVTAAASERAKLGAFINRLEYAADNLANVAQNTDASRSRIEDADYAEETSELARTQIISQASTAMLAQANQVKQSVLALLQ